MASEATTLSIVLHSQERNAGLGRHVCALRKEKFAGDCATSRPAQSRYLINTKLPIRSTMKITVKISRYLSRRRLTGGPKK